MKIECVKEKLKNAVVLADRVTGKNVSLPALKSLVLIAKEKSIVIKATNLEVGVEYEIPARVHREGVTAVPGAVFSSVMSTLYNDEVVTLEVVKDNLFISTKHNSVVVKTESYEDFPLIPRVQGKNKLTIPADKLTDSIKSVWYAASVSDIKPEIASVFIYPDNDDLVLVSTDSFRLAEKKILNIKPGRFDGILIPSKNISDIMRILDGQSGDIQMTFNENQISFSGTGIYITSRLVEGIFPDYRQIVPKEHTTEVAVLEKDFLNALKSSTVFADTFNQITLSVDIAQKTFQVASKNTNIGETATLLPAAINGEDIIMNFNYKYIIESFQSFNSDSVIIRFNGTNKPIVISGLSDKSFLYLVMPMNR
ncbi:MAG: DNA polymerase III subunit beta [Candidatus Lloydbacteria bacterium CG22_combo_CG10-13_8_21_14_all_47_15]|uniref:Beta sliding clamp n=1 Tax=Candidatus Lloydbacteria bacterium CG22_combo_CG10-13_8_21_14_all_47_15 TaxID=1974635 RepID=A0A2H0CUB6_9BACT|nr:MAG: DNA polymerase III subunit beta [Candidatus Lloydbacteria bacterium CG22_combo_CG10-13_8_21_14_all_47_15]